MRKMTDPIEMYFIIIYIVITIINIQDIYLPSALNRNVFLPPNGISGTPCKESAQDA